MSGLFEMLQSGETRTLHILLVEDNEDHAYLVRLAIVEAWEGAQLHHVTNAADAHAYLANPENPPPDLILLDLKLPGTNGLDLLAALKLHSRWRQIPVVVLTTSSAPRDRTRAYEFHANSYLVKPVDAHGFMALIHQLHEYWNRLNQPSGQKPLRHTPLH